MSEPDAPAFRIPINPDDFLFVARFTNDGLWYILAARGLGNIVIAGPFYSDHAANSSIALALNIHLHAGQTNAHPR